MNIKMSNGEIGKLLKEIIIRLDNIERRQMDTDAPLHPGDQAIKIATREFLRGNKEPMKALGKRTMVAQ
jgi:hypothetical protein